MILLFKKINGITYNLSNNFFISVTCSVNSITKSLNILLSKIKFYKFQIFKFQSIKELKN